MRENFLIPFTEREQTVKDPSAEGVKTTARKKQHTGRNRSFFSTSPFVKKHGISNSRNKRFEKKNK